MLKVRLQSKTQRYDYSLWFHVGDINLIYHSVLDVKIKSAQHIRNRGKKMWAMPLPVQKMEGGGKLYGDLHKLQLTTYYSRHIQVDVWERWKKIASWRYDPIWQTQTTLKMQDWAIRSSTVLKGKKKNFDKKKKRSLAYKTHSRINQTSCQEYDLGKRLLIKRAVGLWMEAHFRWNHAWELIILTVNWV